MIKNKIVNCFILYSFTILNSGAQTDSTGYRGTEHSYQNQNSNTIKPDTNMIDENHISPVQEPGKNNSDTMGPQQNKNNSLEYGGNSMRTDRDSMHHQNRSKNFRDSIATLNRQHLSHQDTAQATQPVKAAAPVNSAHTVKPAVPVKTVDNKNNVKTTKNKTMYLVPDSTLRKDTLK